MAAWSKNRKDSSEINGGKEFTTNDNLAVNELNAMVNNSFYAVDFVEAMAETPDISEIDGDGTPNVSLVSNGEFKKFKFSNLKGSKGDAGAIVSIVEKTITVTATRSAGSGTFDGMSYTGSYELTFSESLPTNCIITIAFTGMLGYAATFGGVIPPAGFGVNVGTILNGGITTGTVLPLSKLRIQSPTTATLYNDGGYSMSLSTCKISYLSLSQ